MFLSGLGTSSKTSTLSILDRIANNGGRVTLKRKANYLPVVVPDAIAKHARYRGNAWKQKEVEVVVCKNVKACLDEEKGFVDSGKVISRFSYKSAVDKINAASSLTNFTNMSVLDLTSPGGKFYSHFLFDVLPKLHLLKNIGLDINFFDKIIINFKDIPFIKESFEALKIDFSKVVGRDALNRMFESKLFVSISEPRDNLYTSDWIVDFIRNTFSSTEVVTKFSAIYISRNLGAKRIVVNEDNFIEGLVSAGVDIVHCEKYSIKQNASIFRNADIVVAPHGAGLSNIVFCRPGTTVVELFSSHWSDEFWKLSVACGLHYIPVQVKLENDSMADISSLDYTSSYLKLNSDNMRVNDLLSFFDLSVLK
jgi:capsular polysaccharide biosynthesis protein